MRKAFDVIVVSIMFIMIFALSLFILTSCSENGIEDKTYDVDENFCILTIDADTENIEVIPATDGICRVVCTEMPRLYHSVEVSDGVLKIKVVDERRWFEKISLFGDRSITVYLPADIYTSLLVDSHTGDIDIDEGFTFEHININLTTGDVRCDASAENVIRIKTDTGDIFLLNSDAASIELSATTGMVVITGSDCIDASITTDTGNIAISDLDCEGELEISVDTGRVSLTNITADSLASNGNTGDISLISVVVQNKMSIDSDTGDVIFDRCDAGEIIVNTDSGDVIGTFLTEKIIFATTDTGRIDIPKYTIGGKCDITTDTGDIKIEIQK